ncbi:hypothetical protein [Mucilaginibacter sp. SG538B]|uniref:hypothetical protein n=1 Tax=Mucilaginibacter sp. SG538B TaxID=2587021 RepID=UPI00159D7696|nr:hypothetical protein [Mucilaginibacter sp. SG538B]
MIAEEPRKAFVNNLISGTWPSRVQHYVDFLNQEKDRTLTDFEKLRQTPDEMNVGGFSVQMNLFL